jgi:hypothetical protein
LHSNWRPGGTGLAACEAAAGLCMTFRPPRLSSQRNRTPGQRVPGLWVFQAALYQLPASAWYRSGPLPASLLVGILRHQCLCKSIACLPTGRRWRCHRREPQHGKRHVQAGHRNKAAARRLGRCNCKQRCRCSSVAHGACWEPGPLLRVRPPASLRNSVTCTPCCSTLGGASWQP